MSDLDPLSHLFLAQQYLTQMSKIDGNERWVCGDGVPGESKEVALENILLTGTISRHRAILVSQPHCAPSSSFFLSASPPLPPPTAVCLNTFRLGCFSCLLTLAKAWGITISQTIEQRLKSTHYSYLGVSKGGFEIDSQG